MKSLKKIILTFCCLALSGILFFSCDDASGNSGEDSLSSSKSITSFGFASEEADGTVSTADLTVCVTIPSDSDKSLLTPTIVHTGVSISPASGTEQDFTESVTYTVTAEDGTTAEYLVTVALADEADEADILDLTMQLGEDESSMNFCWFSNDTDATSAVVQIAPKSAMTGFSFPSSTADSFSGTVVTVEISEEEESSDPPPRSDDTTEETTEETDDTSDDDSDETETYLSCEVSATGLSAGTEYVYRIGDGTVFSDMYSFTTGNTDSFSFILVGDPQIGSDDVDTDQAGWEATVTAADTNTAPDFILSMGDQVNTSTSEEEYAAFFAAEELSSLPFVSCIGNHDTDELYDHHFNTPNESEDYGVTEDVGGDYWFTYGNALFMVLNSNNTSTTTHDYFMDEAITAAGDDITWKFVIFHHSIYSTASHAEDTDILERREYLGDSLDTYDIDVAFMGHDHVYCRSYHMINEEAQDTTTTTIDGVDYVEDPEGTLYLTLNSSSGSKYYDIMDDSEWTGDYTYRAFYDQSYEANYSHVELTDTTFTVTTYASDDNSVVDTYSIYKSGSDS
ncbi:MAG: FN3 domain-containing metallophosphoesterase family protein [Spirochaetales bacterium]|nr:FN3 domain-containing metallophosphoesterase family protein [Spirochaetales bacterium]